MLCATLASTSLQAADTGPATSPPGARERIDLAREATLARDVTINALVILNEMPDLEEYFSERVIGGFGAFVIVANDYPDYPEAIRRKLLREIGQTPVGLLDRVGRQLAGLPPVGDVAEP